MQLRPVTAIFHDLHSKGKFYALSDRMKVDKPTLLWIRLAGPACGSGNRRDDHRTSYLVRLIHEQISSHRFVVLEGNVRSQG